MSAISDWANRMRQCVGKRKLSSKLQASVYAKKESRDGVPIYYYRCPVCWSWHLTHQAQKGPSSNG